MGKNIIIISISAKSRSVAPVKLEINLVSPKILNQPFTFILKSLKTIVLQFANTKMIRKHLTVQVNHLDKLIRNGFSSSQDM